MSGLERHKKIYIVLGGLATSIIGLSLCVFYIVSPYNDWTGSISFNARAIVAVVIIILPTLICGLPIDLWARKYCPPRSVLYAALCFTILILIYPMVYGWLKHLMGRYYMI